MKILGICHSPRKGQTTFRPMQVCLLSGIEDQYEIVRGSDRVITI